MAVTQVNYGRANISADPDFGIAAEGQVRACTFNAASQHLWAYMFRAHIGRNTGVSPIGRYGAWEANSNKEPSTRVGYSDQWTASTLMTSGSEGAVVNADVAVADFGQSAVAIQLFSGKRYSLGALPDSASLGFGMAEAALITADEERFFDKSGLSGTIPPQPYGSFSGSIQGHVTIWLECHTNEEPRVVVNRTPSGTIDTTVPVFEGDFRDRNGTWGPLNDGFDDGDVMKRYQIQVRRQSDGVLFWNPSAFNAGPVQQAADRFSKGYEGTTLVRGTTYEWRTRVQDQFDAWSDWSDWLAFTPANLGFVTLDGTPTGKTEVITSQDFQARWTHQTSLSTNAVEIRLKQNDVVVQTSPIITKTVASSASPGTLFTITWAESAFTDLSWGQNYTYAVRGRDTNNQWSDWSAERTFNTNAAPAVPTNLSPENSQVVTSLPLLVCTASDADADDTGASLTVKARIKDNAGAVLFTRTMTWNGTTSRFEYQTTGVDLASFATYKWDAYSFDGTIYSGEQTVEANAVKSTEAVFIYANGPTVTVTAPTEGQVLTTSTPTISWTVTGGTQAKYQIQIFNDGGTMTVYDSGLIVSTATSQAIPGGFLVNNTAYDLVVSVEDTNPLTGYSATRNFSVVYTGPPALTGFQALPVEIGTDPVPTAIRLQWDPTAESNDVFQWYILRRHDLPKPLAYIKSPSQTVWVDYTPVSGVEYTYTVRQVIIQDAANIAGPTVSATAQVDLEGVVLTSAVNPVSYRATLSFGDTRSHTRSGNENFYLPWGATKPTTVRGIVNYWTTDATYFLITDTRNGVTALQRLQELEALEEFGGVMCQRDERGRRRFVVILRDGLTVKDVFPQRADVELSTREEAWDEGVNEPEPTIS